jgi:hypothetical protein
MDLCRDEDGSSTESIGSSSSCHPRSIHTLNETNGSVFDQLELVSKLKLATEPINEKTWINDWDVDILHEDLAAEDLEHLSDFEHINLDGISKVN